MELQELLDSKLYVKPQGGVTYKSPTEYLDPFIQAVSKFTTDFRIETSAETRNANEDAEHTENIAYGRVKIEAEIPELYTALGHGTVVGVIYALDTQKPVIKAYTGKLAWACTNLSVFNAENVFEANLLNNYDSVYQKTEKYLESLEAEHEAWLKKIEALQNTEYTIPQMNEKLGYMLRRSLKQSFSTGVIAAAKELDNHKSPYAVKGDSTTAWNVLAAATQYITDKTDIVTKPDVTLFVESMFKPELKAFGIN